MWNSKQKALLEFGCTKELAKICGLTPEEVLDIVLPYWREIPERSYAESISLTSASQSSTPTYSSDTTYILDEVG